MENPVLLFDGNCTLCNSVVQFVIRRDPTHKFRFASLQGNFGQRMLQQLSLSGNDFETFILILNGHIYTKSTAALKLTRNLSGIWRLLYVFIIVPPVLRDVLYNFVARNRYVWFGKKTACYIPTPELNCLFID